MITMLLWGVLPVALKGLLHQMDSTSIIWYRFLIASILLGALLARRRELPSLRGIGRRGAALLVITTLGLAANYGAYMQGLDLTTAANAQLIIQLAPLLLALGGIVIFRESFSVLQWCGLGVLVIGLGVFFFDQLRAFAADADRYVLGSFWILVAAVTWAAYGLSQKQLLRTLSSQGIMLCIYAGCAVLFAPLARPSVVVSLDATGVFLLAFCAVNTVVAYGAFSEALAHWEASRVSSVLALTPLATVASVRVSERIWPDVVGSTPLSALALCGAFAVVTGSLMTALGASTSREAAPEPLAES
jgi:drug/metabolite transporter (DMT)-like permease